MTKQIGEELIQSEENLIAEDSVNPEDSWKLKSTLPVYKLEYSDGTNWFEVATENFVNVVAKAACIAAGTSGLNIPAVYSNGTAGVGATLTNSGTMAAFTLDGVSPTVGQRVLIMSQTSTFQNGIYVVTNVGSGSTNWVLTRTTDYDSVYLINPGDVVAVVQGSNGQFTTWMQSATVTAIGTSPISFSILSRLGVASVNGTTNQITINGSQQNPSVAIATNPTIPGTGSMVVPGGTAAQRVAAAGALRFWNGS